MENNLNNTVDNINFNSSKAVCIALYRAAKAEDLDRIKYILGKIKSLDKEANIDIKLEGCSPFYAVAYEGDIGAMRILFRSGANINTQDNNGCTPFYAVVVKYHKAVIENDEEAIKKFMDAAKFLFQCGADPDIQNYNDRATPLFFAAQGGDKDMVECLLTGGANPNIQDYQGATALGIAIQEKHLEVVKTLLQYNADFSSILHVHNTDRDTMPDNSSQLLSGMVSNNSDFD